MGLKVISEIISYYSILYKTLNINLLVMNQMMYVVLEESAASQLGTQEPIFDTLDKAQSYVNRLREAGIADRSIVPPTFCLH